VCFSYPQTISNSSVNFLHPFLSFNTKPCLRVHPITARSRTLGSESDGSILKQVLLERRPYQTPEVAGVSFYGSDSASVPKFLNPGPDSGLALLQIWKSDSCSDSVCNHWSNHNLPMFLLMKWPHRLLLLPKWKSDSRSVSGFSQIFDSGSGSNGKTKNPAGVDSGNPDPVPPVPDASEKDLTSRNQTHAPKKRIGRIPCAFTFMRIAHLWS